MGCVQHNAGKVLIDAFYSGPPSPSCLSFCTLSLHIGGRGGDVLGGGGKRVFPCWLRMMDLSSPKAFLFWNSCKRLTDSH